MGRDQYIDIAKGIGIILVLLGHLSIPMILINVIYVFHMPLFFYISGIYMKKRPFRQWLVKNRLLIFYYFSFGILFSILSNIKDLSLVFNDLLFLLQSSSSSIWKISWFGPFWFIVSLFFIRLLCNQFTYFTSIYVSLILFYVSYVFNSMYNNILLDFPFTLGPILMMMLFFNLGKYNSKVVKLYTIRNTIYLILLFIFFNILTIVIYDGYIEKLINYQQMKVVYPLFLAIAGGYIGIISIIYLSKVIEKKSTVLGSIFSYFGKHTLLLFAFHSFFYSKGDNIMHLIGLDFLLIFPSDVTKFITAIVFTIIIIEFLNYLKIKFRIKY